MAENEYRMLNMALRALRVSEKTNKDPDDLRQMLMNYQKKRKYKIPEEYLQTVCDYRIETIAGRGCLIAKPFGAVPERAVLLFYGGGYFKTPDRADFDYLVHVVRETKSEVWFPLYPLAPEADIAAIMEHAEAVYRQMLLKWKPEDIVWQGNSSGGTTCLYLCMKIKHDGETLPYPSRVLMLSPAVQMPPSEEQTKKMQELEDGDLVLSAKYCHSIAEILYHPDYDYLCCPFEFDWTGFPPMMVLFGTKEIFSVFVPGLRETARKYRVPLKGHIGKDMMHCWPMYGNTDAGKRAKIKMFSFICGIDEAEADFDSDDKDLEIVCIYTAANDLEARMIENLLFDNSIPCFRKDLNNAGFMNVYAGISNMGTEIYVAKTDEERAAALLTM